MIKQIAAFLAVLALGFMVALAAPLIPGLNDSAFPEILELARALRSLGPDRPLRLIALTGYGRHQDRAAATAAGFDAFFAKPVEIEALLESLDRPG